MTVSVLIVDDQPLVRHGLRGILGSATDISVAGEAPDGLTGVSAARRLLPDVVLMDIRMPELDGLGATRRVIAEVDPAPAVVILTTFGHDEYVFDALRAGASGFLLKDAPPEEILHAVRVACAGDALLSPSITRSLVEAFTAAPAPRAELRSRLDELTAREREVLECLARGRSNAEIGDALFLAEGTVKTHVARVLQKLGLRDRIQAVIFAYEAGLVRAGDD